MKVYEKIRDYMTKTGISEAVLAERTGIPESRMSELMNGTRILYADDLKKICLALNVSPEAFMGEEGQKGRNHE